MVLTLYHDFNDLLQTLKLGDRNKQCFMLKKMASSIQYSTKEDLQVLLDFINTTHDTELQVKLFSILSIHLINNDTNVQIFVTFSPMYDAIERILSKNLPLKTTVVLNFLTLLLQCDSLGSYVSQKNSLYMHAQNQIRVSGCLASMVDIFTGGMTYQDTWRALCRCLAETCNNSERNQNYCTHLIPKCVIRCSQRNMDTFPVLQSLVCNNQRNVQLFLECEGMSLFAREILQYESSLQLLGAVVQTSIEATIIAQNMSVLQHVQELLHLYGPYTSTGQWATVILYYADIKIKEYEKKHQENLKLKNDRSRAVNTTNIQMNDNSTDTMLFRNVIKEIVQWHDKEKDLYKNIFVSNNKINENTQRDGIGYKRNTEYFNRQVRSRSQNYYGVIDKKSVCHERGHIVDDTSYSFLRKPVKTIVSTNKNKVIKHVQRMTGNFTQTCEKNDLSVLINPSESQLLTTLTTSQIASNFYKEHHDSILDLKEFKPNFVSTPKHKKYANEKKLKSYMNNISVNTRRSNAITKKTCHPEARKKLDDKTLKQRIFNTINNSCTALVNSVTSIFKNKILNEAKKDSNRKTNAKEECSYSFTEFMRKRDAIEIGEAIELVGQNFSCEADSCGSCNDTDVLKHKMIHDNFLKETIKKLKIGINMYGCDFKKISKTMWPHEAYMTPAILYNLYRKLIMK